MARTPEQDRKLAISRLRDLAKEWPPDLWLMVGDDRLWVFETDYEGNRDRDRKPLTSVGIPVEPRR